MIEPRSRPFHMQRITGVWTWLGNPTLSRFLNGVALVSFVSVVYGVLRGLGVWAGPDIVAWLLIGLGFSGMAALVFMYRALRKAKTAGGPKNPSPLTEQLSESRADMPDLEHYLDGKSIGEAVEQLAEFFAQGKALKRRIELSTINIPRATIAGMAETDQVVRERAARDWDADVRKAIRPFGNHYVDLWDAVDGLPDVNPAVALIEPTTDVQGLRGFIDRKLAKLREIMQYIGEGRGGRC